MEYLNHARDCLSEKETMKSFMTILALVSLIFMNPPLPMAEEGKVSLQILSPKEQEIVKNTFEVVYQIEEGIHVNTVDVFLDGIYQKEFSGLIKDVPTGKHQITVKAELVDSKKSAIWQTIHFEVR